MPQPKTGLPAVQKRASRSQPHNGGLSTASSVSDRSISLTVQRPLEGAPLSGKHFDVGSSGVLTSRTVGARDRTLAEYWTGTLDDLAVMLEADWQAGTYLMAGICEPYSKAVARSEGGRRDAGLMIGAPNPSDPDPRARTLPTVGQGADTFSFAKRPGVMVIDTDDTPVRSVIEQLRQVAPKLAVAKMLRKPSSSSCIDLDGQEMRGWRGEHHIIAVADATDIPRALTALHYRLMNAGLGKFVISESGALLSRSIVDVAMARSAQPIFVRAVLEQPQRLTQRMTLERIAGDPMPLDTLIAVPQLSEHERREYAEREAAERTRRTAEITAAKQAHRATTVQGMVARGVGQTVANATMVAALSVDAGAGQWVPLLRDFQLIIQGEPNPVTVREILADPRRFHGRACQDPLEPNYRGGNWAAKVYTDGPCPNVHSFAHGGERQFELLDRSPTAAETFDDEYADKTLGTAAYQSAQAAQQAAADDSASGWPPAFRMTPSGLRRVVQKETGETLEPVTLTPFRIVGEVRPRDGIGWGLLLEWQDADATAHRVALSRALMQTDPTEALREMAGRRLVVAPGSRARAALLAALIEAEPKRRLWTALRAGWMQVDNAWCFITRTQVYGPRAVDIHYPGLGATGLPGADFTVGGTLAEWKSRIGAHVVTNSRLAVAVGMALAGPLLDVLGTDSGGIHLFGQSQSGKTTALRVAASVYGRGDRGKGVGSWRATENGLELLGSHASDTVLVLDELAQLDAKAAASASYLLAHGSGKGRMTRDGTARPTIQFRAGIVSSGELSMSEKAAEAGGTPLPAGAEVRILSIPADAGAGLGVFDDLGGYADGGALADALSEACVQQFGTLGQAWLAYLAESRSRDEALLRSAIEGHLQAFIQAHLPASATAQVATAYRRLGLANAALTLAQGEGLLPPGPVDTLLAAVGAAWVAARGGIGAGEDIRVLEWIEQLLERYEARLERLTIDTTDPANPTLLGALRPPPNRDGYILDDGGQTLLFLPRSTLAGLGAPVGAAAIEAALRRVGALVDRTRWTNSEGRFLAKSGARGRSRMLTVDVTALSEKAAPSLGASKPASGANSGRRRSRQPRRGPPTSAAGGKDRPARSKPGGEAGAPT